MQRRESQGKNRPVSVPFFPAGTIILFFREKSAGFPDEKNDQEDRKRGEPEIQETEEECENAFGTEQRHRIQQITEQNDAVDESPGQQGIQEDRAKHPETVKKAAEFYETEPGPQGKTTNMQIRAVSVMIRSMFMLYPSVSAGVIRK